jgi:hypothetical protein
MHTTQTSGATFIHNGDYSGPITVFTQRDPDVRLEVMMDDLKEFVAEYVRKQYITNLEQLPVDDILGI